MRPCRADVALVLVEEGQAHAHLDTRGVVPGLEIVTVGDPHLDVGDRFDLFAFQADLGARHLGSRDLDFRAGFQQVGHSRIHFRDGCRRLQIAVQPPHRQGRIADKGGELLPGGVVLGANFLQSDTFLPGLDARLQQIRLIRRANVHQFLSRLHGVVGHLEQVGPHAEETLHRQQLVEARADAVDHAVLLGESLSLHLGNFLTRLRAVQP